MLFVKLPLLLLPLFACALAQAATTLSVCTDANPEGFDVVQYNSLATTNASADVLMNRLVDYDAKLRKLVPSLAESWTVSPDGLTYVFKLRRGVKFHSTDYFKPSRDLDSEDVAYTFRRMLDPKNAWHNVAVQGFPHAQSMQLPVLVKKIETPEGNTVSFTLDHPDATFLASLSMGFASIYSAEYMMQLMNAGTPEKLNTQPIGTGPFVFKSFLKDQVIRYQANPAYFAGKPGIDALVYAITPDASIRAQRIKENECQVMLSPKPLDIAELRNDPDLKVEKIAAFMTSFVAINSQHPPLDKPEVRRAINLAFDKATYLKTLFDGSATAADGPLPPSTWGYANDLPGYKHDVAKARALLSKVGLKDGFKTTIWTRPTGSTLNPNPGLGAQLLQADLKKIGISSDIKMVEWGELIRRAKAGEHDLLFMGWSGENGDPDNFLTPQFSCAALQSGTNFARYCDADLDNLINDGKGTNDQSKRTKIYERAQAVIQRRALWLPLAHPAATVIIRRNVVGYSVSPFGRQDFSRVTLK